MKLGIIGPATDPHCIRIKAVAEKLGADVILIESNVHSAETALSIVDGCAYYGERSLDDVDTFFLRSVASPVPYVRIEEERMLLYQNWHVQYMRNRETYGLMLSWLLTLVLQGKRVMNPPAFGVIGQLKPYQTNCLIQAGLPMPETILTSNPALAKRFISTHRQVIYKPIMGGDVARLIEDSDCFDLSAVTKSPVILQKYVKGDNLRVFLTRNKILSICKISSDAVDFRASSSYSSGMTEYKTETLPHEIEELCFKALKHSGYEYTAIDLVRVFPYDYYFLECNFAPAYAEIEDKTGHSITTGLVEYLLTERFDSLGQHDVIDSSSGLFGYPI